MPHLMGRTAESTALSQIQGLHLLALRAIDTQRLLEEGVHAAEPVVDGTERRYYKADLLAQRLAECGYVALTTQPLLMMVGEVADTRCTTEGIFGKVFSKDKALTFIPGASRIDAY